AVGLQVIGASEHPQCILAMAWQILAMNPLGLVWLLNLLLVKFEYEAIYSALFSLL
ncbi:hypothetical protein ACJX0J_029528, partial [Zea mays]